MQLKAEVEHRRDKRASQIARRIEADIIRRGWPIGRSLGSEQALQQRYQVSRSVVREAVRLVEHHRVARMRRGPNGGLLVREPDAAPATHAIIIYLEYLGTTIDDLLDARLLLEPVAAALAAERIDEAGIDRLRAAVDAEQQSTTGRSAACAEFHAGLAEQSKNPVLQLFIDILIRLTHRHCPVPSDAATRLASAPGTRYAGDLRVDATSPDIEAIDRTQGEHLDIVAAVAAGDSAGAKTLSERHAESVTAWLRGRQAWRRGAPAPCAQAGRIGPRGG